MPYDKIKKQPPLPQYYFYAYLQVTFKVWKQTNFFTFFPNKNL